MASTPMNKREKLAELLRQKLARADKAKRAPLSPAQERMWFLDQWSPGSPTQNMGVELRLEGELDVAALERSLREIVRRHEVLRATFRAEEGRPVQHIAPSLTIELPIVDLEGEEQSKRESEARERLLAEARRPFDLERGPLFRALLFRLGKKEQLLLINMHHIVSDGWSMGVLVRELSALYREAAFGEPARLAPLPLQYTDYAAWQRDFLTSEAFASQLSYWRTRLDPGAVLLLPTDRPRPATLSSRGARETVVLDKSLLAALKAESHQAGTTLFVTLLAAFQTLLFRYTGQTDIAVGSPIAGRKRAELEGLIGLFVNTLVLRADLSGEPSFRELSRQLHEVVLDANAHQDLPFEKLVDVLKPERSASLSPLFQVMFILQNAPMPRLEMPGLVLKAQPVDMGTSKFDLTVIAAELSEGLRLIAEYNTDLFDAGTIKRLLAHLELLLSSLTSELDRPISSLPLLPETERRQMLEDFSRSDADFDRGALIHTLFEAQVARTPDRTALFFDNNELSYAELDARSTKLAHYLARLGVGPESRVGVALPRSPEMIVALLGILKAGAAYVALDPAQPQERLSFIVRDSQAFVIVTQQAFTARFDASRARSVLLDAEAQAIAKEPDAPLSLAISPDNPAYLLYTSGSTGVPKGVLGLHRGAVNRFQWMWRAFPFAPDELCCQKTTLNFADAVWEIFGPLLQGVPIVLLPDEIVKDPPRLVERLSELCVTRFLLVPSLLRAILETDLDLAALLPRLVYFSTSGEALPQDLAEAFMRRLPHATLINLYGMTEASADATSFVLRPGDPACSRIGRPIANTQVFVLDARLSPVPIAVPGELFVAGEGLARGYWGLPALSAERFLPNPFSATPGARMYRTGDRARFLPSGDLEFLGRVDDQLKIRGFRIEPGEIAAALASHPAVCETAVMARADEHGQARLVAYVVFRAEPLTTALLRTFLEERLPDYMVPWAYVTLERLPLAPNGKLDRHALPAPELPCSAVPFVAPRTKTEDILAGIWAEVLGRSSIGVQDNFFELGGHSLLATQVLSRVRTVFGPSFSVRTLFEAPTVEILAARLDAVLVTTREPAARGAQRVEVPLSFAQQKPTTRGAKRVEVPLSFAQQRLFFLSELQTGVAFFNMPVAVRMTGELNVEALRRSLQQIVTRHDALRTTFAVRDNQPTQIISPSLALPVPIVDLDDFEACSREGELERHIAAEIQRPFDLAQGPLIRATLYRLGPCDHRLLLDIHHIVSDGWSMGVLVRELFALYQAFAAGLSLELAPLPLQYGEYAAWQRSWLSGEVLEEQLSYWRGRLDPNALLALPTDKARPLILSPRGARRSLFLSPSLTETLEALARREGRTLFVLLLSAFEVLLSRYTGKTDIVVGTLVAGRARAELEGLIGLFINALALRCDLSGEPSFRTLMGRVQETVIDAQAHQDIPFERIVDALKPERRTNHAPLFQVLFVLQNAPMPPLEMPGLVLEARPLDTGMARHELGLYATLLPEGLRLTLEFSTDLFEPETALRLLDQLGALLQGAVDNPDQCISELPLLPESARRQILVAWNDTKVPYPKDACVHELFARQAERSPDAIAVVFEREEISYRELSERVNRLAHRLARIGVGPEILVALCLERSIDMVVAIFAVLSAGGAYVPLDPTHPRERLSSLLEDIHAPIVLTQQKLRDRLPEGAGILCLDADWATIAEEEASPVRGGAGLSSLAYVIYTSGSTGRPKGVLCTHGGLLNRIFWMQEALDLRSGEAVLQKTPYGFDVSVWELIWPFLVGARLVIARPEGHRDSEYLAGLIEEQGISTIHFVPSMFAAFIEVLNKGRCPSLRRIVCSGEALSRDLVERFYAKNEATIINLYGPTEASIDVSFFRCPRKDERRIVPIGRPIANTYLYVLDGRLVPVPIGMPGELYIGGAGLARGYLNRASLSAERFLPDPFAPDPGARMYRTGDLTRFLPDGQIEFLGRIDHQVKIRGFRIELGEIEATLAAHPEVKEALVLAREEVSGDKRLVAYLVPAAASDREDAEESAEIEIDRTGQWQSLYEATYGNEQAEDPKLDMAGWNSSYTGEAIDEREMRQWVEWTVSQILAFRPSRILELGCGTGLLLLRVAPSCDVYLGVDFSAAALRHIERQRERMGDARGQVTLLHRKVDDFSGIEEGAFDTVVLNSVVQYFPSEDYLSRVLAGALRAVRPGGRVLIGDVRSLPLLAAFRASVRLYRASPSAQTRELVAEVHRDLLSEEELVIDPALFSALASVNPKITRVEVMPKRGRYDNELSRFRYDVVLHAGEREASAVEISWLEGSNPTLSLASIRQKLEKGPLALGIASVPNARVERDLRLAEALRRADIPASVAGLRGLLDAGDPSHAIHPEDLYALGAELGYDVRASWLSARSDGAFDVAFVKKGGPDISLVAFPPAHDAKRPLGAYTNDPTLAARASKLIPRIRQWLAERLPDYMIPSAFVALGALPIGRHGKLDRAALPPPVMDRSAASGQYLAPRTPVEGRLAAIFAEVLGQAQIGIRDDFFALGGHSLMLTQVVARARRAFGIELGLQEAFQSPTVEGLASRIEVSLRREQGLDVPSISKTPRNDTAPLSFAQERLWFLDQLEPGLAFYNIPAALRLSGALNIDALRRSFDEVVRRHEMLRTTFEVEDGRAFQRIHPPARFELGAQDLTAHPEKEREAARMGEEVARRPFDIEKGPLLVGELIKLDENEHVLIFNMHHIASDGWSVAVLTREIAALYQAYCRGLASPLAELGVQYADYAIWQRGFLQGELLEEQLAYWQDKIAGVPPLELPTDRARPLVQRYRGATVPVEIPRSTSAGLHALCRHEGVTLFMVLLAAFSTLLHRLSGQSDIAVGSPIAGRRFEELEGLIGFFVNTLVLRVKLEDDHSFRELLTTVKETTLAAYAHQDMPFEKLVAHLQPERDLSRQPLFQVSFALQNAPLEPLRVEGLELSPIRLESGTAKFDLALSLFEQEGRIRGTLEYATDLFEHTTAARMVERLCMVLEAIVRDPNTRGSRLPMITASEQQDLLCWNATEVPYPKNACVHELFEEQAERTPDAIALLYAEETLSYGELNKRANRLARRLSRLGVGPEVRVGLFAERSPAAIIGLLAILKAGGIYVPLDPSYPAARLSFMLEDTGARAVLCDTQLVASWPRAEIPLVPLELGANAAALERDENLDVEVSAEGGAYVVFTSGSTGKPKGVLVPHRGVVRLACASRHLRISQDDVLFQYAPLAFDASTFEIWSALLSGAKLAIAPPSALTHSELGRALRRYGVTTLWLTAALFHQVIDTSPDVLSPVRTLLAGGEALSPRHVERALTLLPDCRVINGYGPTENTTFTCLGVVEEPSWQGSVPIGTPLDNTRVYVLDDKLWPVPVGVVGELYASGDGLARGYFGRPGLTAERFLPDPFSAEPSARMYRTGDLVRFLSDGRLDFLGRRDDQVKVRGYRIELGEIESVLSQHDHVREVTVMAREDRPGDKRLVAYIVAAGEPPSAQELRAFIKARLPEHMVPAAFIMLPSFPLNKNGKLDRRALPAPESMADPRGFVAPRTPSEARLAALWSELLERSPIGARDNFFELGGHSLLVTRLVARVRAIFGVELPIRAVFEGPTLEELNERIEAATRKVRDTEASWLRARSDELSFAQQRLWFLDQLEPGSPFYNIAVALRLRGVLDAAILRRAINEVVQRHEALRTIFVARDERPTQLILPELAIPLEMASPEGHSLEEREAFVRALLQEQAALSFDLAKGPLVRTLLVRISDEDHVLLVTMHHIVSDGWSLGILVREIGALYAAFSQGRSSPLPPLPCQYAQVTAWQRAHLQGEVLAAELSYWRKELGGRLPVLELPTDRPRPAIQSYHGAQHRFLLPPSLGQALTELGRSQGATLFMTLLSAFQILLYRYTGEQEIIVGSPIAGRTQAEFEGLIGFFVNTLALRARVDGHGSFRQLLEEVREVTLGAYAHQTLPFEKLVEELNPVRDLSRSPIFQVLFALQNAPSTELSLPGLSLERLVIESGVAKFDLSMMVEETEEALQCVLEYNTDLFDKSTISRMAENYRSLLEGIVERPDAPIVSLPLVSETEHQMLLEAWNGTHHRALPAPEQPSPSSARMAPRTRTEEQLAAIWSESLGHSAIGVHDNFFDLGGHSLLVTRVLSRVRTTFNVELSVRAVFEAPTVEALAARIDEARGAEQVPALRPASREGDLPLSFAQQRLWFLAKLDPKSPFYNVPVAVRLRGSLDVVALGQSIEDVVRRHEALRTSFGERGGKPTQIIAPEASLELEFESVDDADEPARAREERAQEICRREAQRPFDLSKSPLVRALLVRLSADDHVLLVTMHHIVSDGWSLGVLVRELSALYTAFSQGKASPLPPLSVQYADYAAWQQAYLQGEVLATELGYWREQLGGQLSPLDLPTDRPRPVIQSHHGALHRFLLPPSLGQALTELGRSQGATLFMTLLSAFQILLYRYTGEQEIIVGSPIAGRTRAEFEGLIGFFVNTLALRARVDGHGSFRQLLEEVREVTLGAYAHQTLPFEKLVEELNPVRDLSRSPIFQVLFALQNMPSTELSLPGLSLEPLPLESGIAKFDLSLTFEETNEGLRGAFEYNTDLFDDDTIARMAGHYRTLLEGIAKRPDAPIASLPLLSGVERQTLLVEWNQTESELSRDALLSTLFEAQAERTPEAVALVFGDQQLCYGELDARSNQLAHKLRALGVGPEVLVGLCAERSLEMVVGLLGILKAGGAYVPLDPSYPAERLSFMIEDADAPVLLIQERFRDKVDAQGKTVLFLDAPLASIASERTDKLPPLALPDNLAYVIYTSGSTGRPKGAMNAHRGVVNRLSWGQKSYGLSSSDIVLQKTPFSFDVSVWEFFWPLITGARLVLARPGGHKDPTYLARLIREQAITTLHFVPSMLRAFLEEASAPMCASIERVFSSGEALPYDLAERFFERFPKVPLYNLYGPTETAVEVTAWSARPNAERRIPMGRPIANTRALVLDEALEPAPVGVPGELFLGGVQVGRGYLGRPGLSADRFVPDPYSMEPGARLYRTGDRCRWLSDGTLEYLGRLDFQVKVRGFRIELGEIESVLTQHPAASKVAVVVREDRSGDKGLVAYVVADQDAPSASALREFLRARIPEYMVPSAFVFLDRLPLTPSGKLDRRALPAPEAPSSSVNHVAPRTRTEEQLAAVWGELLGHSPIGMHDNFFELGGHSLLVMRVLSRVRTTFDVELSVRALFEAPTVEALAARVDEARGYGAERVPALRPASREGDLPLSFAQQRLWFLAKLDPKSPFYNVPVAVRLRGSLDVAALGRSLEEVVRRHEALRTSFGERGGRPTQIIVPEASLELESVDVADEPARAREERAQELCRREAQRPFDLSKSPLVRALVVRLSADDHVLLVTMHHIVSDGWSLGVLVRELSALYTAFSQGKASPLPPLSVQYADYAAWQQAYLQGEVLATELGYWREQLGGQLSPLDLPTDRPRPAIQSHHGALHSFLLPPSLGQALTELGRSQGATLFMTLLSAFQILLYRYTGQEDIIVGSPIAGRTRAEFEGLIGFFVNTLALRARVDGHGSFRQLLEEVREVTLGAYAHQTLPFEKLVEELNPVRDLSRSPIFQVLFALQNVPSTELSLPGLSLEPLPLESGIAKFDLGMVVEESEEGLRCAIEYNTDLFDKETISRMAGHYRNLLEGIVERPDASIASLPLLSETERQTLLEAWNDTRAPLPHGQAIHELFAERARRTPHAIAVASEARRLSYGELDARANQLAQRLRALGVGAESRVGLLVERGAEMVVGLLGILKAGGAYVPLDPSYPSERLGWMIEDAGISVLVAHRPLLEKLPQAPAQVVCIEDEAWQKEPFVPPLPKVDGQNLAYVIYTSGSTGKPKGVGVTHENVLRLALCRRCASLGEQDITAQLSNIAFDAATLEIWGTLLHGGRVVIFSREATLSPRLLAEAVARERISAMFLTVALFNQLAREIPDALSSVGTVFFGGEAADASSVRHVLEKGRPARLVNGYGPTETTTLATYHEVIELGKDAVSVPIGLPLSNTTTHVLDARLELVPMGVHGELYIGGAGVARGYLGRPGLTAERFLPDPHSSEPGARMYKTGDIVRRRGDGTIDYIGRADFQVKLRGHRIELGEIEAALPHLRGVKQAAVLLREDLPGDKRLVAYVVLEKGEALDASSLRARLKESLPDYMIPSAFVALSRLPLNANGKLDRRALPAPDASSSSLCHVAPRTRTEERLAAIWGELFGHPAIGAHDNFFELGGHSLLAARLVSRIEEELGQRLPVLTLFQKQTLEELALAIDRGSEAPSSCLVRMRAGVTGNRPLFFVPGAGGSVLHFAELIRYLDPARPFYAFQAPGLVENEMLPASVEEIARHYIAELRALEPKGPYLLGGWSAGGVFAFEMARALKASGEPVELLVLLDAHLPRSGPAPDDLELLAAFGQSLGLSPRQLPLDLDVLRRQGDSEKIAYVLEQARLRGLDTRGLGLEQAIRAFGVFKRHAEALTRYAPQPYEGSLLLLRAKEHGDHEPRTEDLGWRAWITGELAIAEVPGDHYTMMRAPNVEMLAAELGHCLKMIEEREGL